MAKTKFYYNYETCKYEPIIPSRGKIAFNFIGFFFLSLSIAAGLIYSYHTYFTPVKQSILLTKNNELKNNWEHQQIKINNSRDEILQLREKDDFIYRTILDIDPIPNTVRLAGTGGNNKYEDLENLDLEQGELIINTFKEVEKLRQQLSIQESSFDDVENILSKKRVMWDSRPAIHPLHIRDIMRTGSGFGMRFHPIHNKMLPHRGLDVRAELGTEIHATGDGVIKKMYRSISYGYVIFVDHGYGYETRYAHMLPFSPEEAKAAIGKRVERGDLLGFVGNSGWSTAAHIHYEVLQNGHQINPVPYLNKNLSKEEYEKIAETAENSNLVLEY